MSDLQPGDRVQRRARDTGVVTHVDHNGARGQARARVRWPDDTAVWMDQDTVERVDDPPTA